MSCEWLCPNTTSQEPPQVLRLQATDRCWRRLLELGMALNPSLLRPQLRKEAVPMMDAAPSATSRAVMPVISRSPGTAMPADQSGGGPERGTAGLVGSLPSSRALSRAAARLSRSMAWSFRQWNTVARMQTAPATRLEFDFQSAVDGNLLRHCPPATPWLTLQPFTAITYACKLTSSLRPPSPASCPVKRHRRHHLPASTL